MAPRVLNIGEGRGRLLERVARQVALAPGPELAAIREELLAYPGPVAAHAPDATAIMLGLERREL